MHRIDLHLASSSARRRDILEALGLAFSWAGVDLDETPLDGESALELAQRLAAAKAGAARASMPETTPILAADTVVVAGDEVLGKPRDRDDALAMLRLLSDGVHEVITAIAVESDGRLLEDASRTEVRFRAISGGEASAYWDSGEPHGKAGAYAIQGLGGVFVESIAGSYSGVVGLPVFETAALLRRIGIQTLASAVKRETG
ncbi:MAG: septum formation inhibitor Maf [Gammaproteobacteria bacterium]|nr:septum formation inhibitor Maf [Gammaproteobacteria bacterium]